MWREHYVLPESDKLGDVDETPNVVFGAFCEHLFVDPHPVLAVGQVICVKGCTPADIQRQIYS